MDTDGLDYLRRQIEEQKQIVQQAMADGKAKDFADYQHMCGRLLGMSTAQWLIDEMADRLKNQDD